MTEKIVRNGLAGRSTNETAEEKESLKNLLCRLIWN